MSRTETTYIPDADYRGACSRCGSTQWVAASFNGGMTRVPQCMPCGRIHWGVVLADKRNA